MSSVGTERRGIGRLGESRKHSASPKPKKSKGHSPKVKANPDVPREAKVVLCHGTHSKTKPGVTISVSGHALAGLGNDTSGACG